MPNQKIVFHHSERHPVPDDPVTHQYTPQRWRYISVDGDIVFRVMRFGRDTSSAHRFPAHYTTYRLEQKQKGVWTHVDDFTHIADVRVAVNQTLV
tara:strand:- start:738 stop:1022 length:285 start_codon:yes stop_codon:yes gene_type:complete